MRTPLLAVELKCCKEYGTLSLNRWMPVRPHISENWFHRWGDPHHTSVDADEGWAFSDGLKTPASCAQFMVQCAGFGRGCYFDKTKAEFRLKFPRCIRLFTFYFTTAIVFCAQLAVAGDDPSLPDAPQPTAETRAVLPHLTFQTSQMGVSSPARLSAAPRLAKYVGADQSTVRLSAKEKLELSGLEQLQPYAFLTQLVGAGWEQLINGDPKFGSDSGAFGERLGSTALLQTSRAILSDGIMASIFRQDPRYYRASHRPVKQRIYHGAERVFIIRSDQGKPQPNYSQLLGNAVATALTMTYYPAVSATVSGTVEGYVISLGTAALGNEIHEFTPVIKRVVVHHHR